MTCVLAVDARLGTLDWVVVSIYLLVLLVSGYLVSKLRPAGADEYFLAGRRMPVWAVVFSIIASSLSVATFVGAPEQSFKGNLTYLSTNIGSVLGIFIVAWVFIPAFYRDDCVTIYELLERRMGRGARTAASAAFMLGRVFASGARVFIAAIPMAAVIFGMAHINDTGVLIAAILILSGVAVLYTLIGGIASVIWTDVIQTLVMIVAIIACIIYLATRLPVPPGEAIAALATGGPGGTSKLTVIDPGLPFDPSAPFTLITAVFAFSLISVASYGTDHDMVQRMLTCRSAIKGGRSALTATIVAIPVVSLFMLIGLMLWVFYNPALYAGSTPPGEPGAQAFLTFIVSELPAGLAGAIVAGLFAVGLGSLNSAINAMAATFVKDFYVRWVPGRSERHYLLAGRWAVVGWGAVLAAFAILCIFWKRANPDTKLIDFALGIMTFAYSGLLAVFLSALFTTRGSSRSAVAALATGFLVVAFFQSAVWLIIAGLFPGLFPPPPEGTTAHTAASLSEFLPWLRLAFPWHMVIATGLAFLVCQLGRPDRHRGSPQQVHDPDPSGAGKPGTAPADPTEPRAAATGA
jgi:SSS family solute:Na+ symporter